MERSRLLSISTLCEETWVSRYGCTTEKRKDHLGHLHCRADGRKGESWSPRMFVRRSREERDKWIIQIVHIIGGLFRWCLLRVVLAEGKGAHGKSSFLLHRENKALVMWLQEDKEESMQWRCRMELSVLGSGGP